MFEDVRNKVTADHPELPPAPSRRRSTCGLSVLPMHGRLLDSLFAPSDEGDHVPASFSPEVNAPTYLTSTGGAVVKRCRDGVLLLPNLVTACGGPF